MAEMTQKGTFGTSTTTWHDPIAKKLDQLHGTLDKIDRAMGKGHIELPVLHELSAITEDLATYVERVAPELRERFEGLVAFLRNLPSEIESRLASIGPSKEIESRPLFGLPLARVVPQDVHTLIDYFNGGACMVTALLADEPSTKIAGMALGSSVAMVSALTDYRISAAKVIPIEAHEAIDHLWGVTAIAAPFVLGYWKKDPLVAAMHVFHGATTILVSLFTDYRAAEGVGREAIDDITQKAGDTYGSVKEKVGKTASRVYGDVGDKIGSAASSLGVTKKSGGF